MRVTFNPISTSNSYQINKKKQLNSLYSQSLNSDKFEYRNKQESDYNYRLVEKGNTLRLIAFKGVNYATVTTPKLPSIRTGLDNSELYKNDVEKTKSITRGEALKFRLVEGNNNTQDEVDIEVLSPTGKKLGDLPKYLTSKLGKKIQEEPDAYTFLLYGTVSQKGSKPANVLTTIEYHGKNKAEIQELMNSVLYKNIVTPEEVLGRILDYKKVLYGEEVGSEKIKEAQLAIDTIVKTIEDPANQKILLIGHNKPDGDTIGSCAGMKAALQLLGKQQVDIAIDDLAAGFLRNFVSTKEIKKSPEFEEKLKKGLNKRYQDIIDHKTDISTLSEIFSAQQTQEYYQKNISFLKKDDKYDLAIFLDVPSPGKVSPEILKYARNAKKVIYVDHHPIQKREWLKESDNNGLNLGNLTRDHLIWTEPKVPANTMLVSILVNKLLPNIGSEFKIKEYNGTLDKDKKELLNTLASSLVVGTITDTGGYKRNINRSNEDLSVPQEKRITFAPQGLSDWLLNLTNGAETKRSIKNRMKYDLPNKVKFYFPQDYVDFYSSEPAKEELMDIEIPDPEVVTKTNDPEDNIRKRIAEDVEKNTKVYPEIGLGISKIPYDSLKKFLYECNLYHPDINLRDVVGAYKFNRVTIALKYQSKDPKYKVDPKYEENKILATIRQDEVKGDITSSMGIADENSIGFSFRSHDGTNYALILATLFGGGGHNAAAGATLTMPEINMNSKLSVIVNGKKENSFKNIYNAAYKAYQENYLYPDKPNSTKIEIIKDDNGYTAEEIVKKVVKEIREANNK